MGRLLEVPAGASTKPAYRCTTCHTVYPNLDHVPDSNQCVTEAHDRHMMLSFYD